MRSSIGNIRWIFFLTAAFSLISVANFSQGFYVSQKRCANTTAPTAGGGGALGGTTGSSDCTEPVMFFDTDRTSVSWSWNFGDPAATASNLSTLRNPKHSFLKDGNYIVTLVRTFSNATTQTVTQNVRVGKLPLEAKLYDKKELDTTLCDGKSLKLDPYKHLLGIAPPGVSFIWYPKGETTQSITVTKNGCYSVEVFDPTTGCGRTVRAKVNFCGQDSPSSGGTEKWYFGKNAVLDFTRTTKDSTVKDTLADAGDLFGPPKGTDPTFEPKASNDNPPLDAPEGVSMFYDSQGKLILTTDGVNIWGENKQALPARLPLTDNKMNGTPNATQTSVIVPKSTCGECPHHQYYVFTLNKKTQTLSYSVVDMRFNNGQGAIVEKDVPYFFPTSERITAKMSDDETGFHIFTHDVGTNKFKILRIDSTGIKEKEQAIGLVHDDTTSLKGYMKLSPFGRQMAVAVSKNGRNYVEVFEITEKNGEVVLVLQKSIDLNIPAPPYVYGLEFNQDESKLYVTLRGDPSKGQKSSLYQLNLLLPNATDIANNKKLIDESTTLAFGALQMGPTDPNQEGAKSIYMAVDGVKELPYLYQPDFLATGATLKDRQALVGYQPIGGLAGGAPVTGTSHFGLPTITRAKPEQSGSGLEATYAGTCEDQPTIFTTKGTCSPMKGEAYWDFGDGTTGKGLTAEHTYEKPGRYKIKLRLEVYSETFASKNAPSIIAGALREKCTEFIVVDELYIKPSPIVNLADSAFVCVMEGATIELDPKPTNTYSPTFIWKTVAGAQIATTQKYTAGAIGTYIIEAKNNFANSTSCKATDKILVKEGCEPRLFVPEAFTPNPDDAFNRKLDVPNAHITNFVMRIYNRWGEVVFESKDPEDKWDGSYKGETFAPAIYAYYISFKSRDFPYRPPTTKVGGIVVIQ